MNAHEALITEHVLETTKEFPVLKRATYLHALAALSSNPTFAGDIEQLAQDLESADRRQGELALSLRRSA